MSKRRGANKENLEETRQLFLKLARTEFTEHGYMGSSTNRIVEQSGMARGSLYYHFGEKRTLFKSVYEDAIGQALCLIARRMDEKKDPWEAFLGGTEEFLNLCMTKSFRKIALIEAQTALSFEERLQILQGTLLGKLVFIITKMQESGSFQSYNVPVLTTIIYGMLSEIGRSFEFSPDIQTARKEYEKAFRNTMQSMRTL